MVGGDHVITKQGERRVGLGWEAEGGTEATGTTSPKLGPASTRVDESHRLASTARFEVVVRRRGFQTCNSVNTRRLAPNGSSAKGERCHTWISLPDKAVPSILDPAWARPFKTG